MNLRGIKKDIEYVLGAFIEDCSIFVAINPKADEAGVSAIMEEAVDVYNELRDKANAKVEGSQKAYYADLRKEILARTDALYEKLSAAVKAASEAPVEKPAAKKPAAKKAAKKEDAAEAPAEKKTAARKPAAKKAPAKKAEPKAE